MVDVFKALADPSRRHLLDRLNARNGQSLRELSESLTWPVNQSANIWRSSKRPTS